MLWHVAQDFKGCMDVRWIEGLRVIHTRGDWTWCVFTALKTHQKFVVTLGETWGVPVRPTD